ncbi:MULTISPECIES: restriction endonuclease subunit S [Shewanella]|uniref:restriction endonuclease subunit S n=1 Tax=Shewanella TaxID=22 RepID=UPI000029C997|nr:MULTISPECIES: restriction endonuclease subunit S [Shewanella]PWH01737.1 restriction endonuclease subunit S [Shewanella xiamenensis]
MNHLSYMEKLLDGVEVEWKPLEEVIHSLKTGLNPRQNFQLNTSDAQGYYVTVREIQDGKIVFLDKTDRVNDRALELINGRSKLEVGDILFSGTGTVGRTAIIEEKPANWNIKEGVYTIKPIQEKILPRFLSHLLNSSEIVKDYSKKIVGNPVVSLPMGELKKLLIPIPCPDNPEKSLEIQAEIVRILDAFTAMTAELTAELNMRKKQYNYYRDQLLGFEEGDVEWKTLEEVAHFANGKGHEKDISEDGKFIVVNSKFISTDGLVAKYSDSQICPLFKDDILLVMSDLPNGKALSKTFIVDEDERYTLNQRIGGITVKDKSEILPKFLHYFLDRTPQLLKHNNGVDQTNLRKGQILEVKVPILPLHKQEHIVSILDKFDKLTKSLSEGLPREIELRQKQYEYYRDLLLSFPKSDEAA